MLILVVDQTPNINKKPISSNIIHQCRELFHGVQSCRCCTTPDHDPTITSQPIGFDTDPFDRSGTIAWWHQWDSNHTSSPGEKSGTLILGDQVGHPCVYATLPCYLIRDTLLLRELFQFIC